MNMVVHILYIRCCCNVAHLFVKLGLFTSGNFPVLISFDECVLSEFNDIGKGFCWCGKKYRCSSDMFY